MQALNFEPIVGVVQNMCGHIALAVALAGCCAIDSCADSPNRGVFSDAKITHFKVAIYYQWKLLGGCSSSRCA